MKSKVGLLSLLIIIALMIASCVSTAPPNIPTPKPTATTSVVLEGCSLGMKFIWSNPGKGMSSSLSKDECVEIIGRNQNSRWVLISGAGERGWMKVADLEITGDVETLPVKSSETGQPESSNSNTQSSSNQGNSNCDKKSYPTVCIPLHPPDLDCGDISFKNFKVNSPDPHNFDTDNDGVGCEN